MSFGRSSGRSGSFTKQKKEKRRKQDFHKHRVKFTESEKLDFSSFRDKAVASLVRLGKQKFSREPGGYGFENWMKSFNLLLDNFEANVGPNNLPKNYFDKRQEFTSSLLKPIESGEGSEISELQEKEKGLLEKLEKMSADFTHEHDGGLRVSKIDALNVERATHLDQLEEERKRLAMRRKEVEDSKSFFKKIFSGGKDNGPSLASIQAMIDELEGKVQRIDRRISDTRRKLDQKGYRVVTERELKKEFPKEFSEIEELRSKIEEIQKNRENDTQNLMLREQVTESMSKLVSGIELPASNAIAEAS